MSGSPGWFRPSPPLFGTSSQDTPKEGPSPTPNLAGGILLTYLLSTRHPGVVWSWIFFTGLFAATEARGGQGERGGGKTAPPWSQKTDTLPHQMDHMET